MSRHTSTSRSVKRKPGLTAKLHPRQFVVHNYHDYSTSTADMVSAPPYKPRRGGVATPFPEKLHKFLDLVERDGYANVISWQPHGRCFVIHKPKEFEANVMPRYFNQTKLTSFQRQLNLYGFQRLTRGPDTNGYYHECFLRGKAFLITKMVRTRIKGTKVKAASSPEQEPDFYAMPPLGSSRSVVTSNEDKADAVSLTSVDSGSTNPSENFSPSFSRLSYTSEATEAQPVNSAVCVPKVHCNITTFSDVEASMQPFANRDLAIMNVKEENSHYDPHGHHNKIASYNDDPVDTMIVELLLMEGNPLDRSDPVTDLLGNGMVDDEVVGYFLEQMMMDDP